MATSTTLANDLAELIDSRGGATARELATTLDHKLSAINEALYSNPDLFAIEPSSIPRWFRSGYTPTSVPPSAHRKPRSSPAQKPSAMAKAPPASRRPQPANRPEPKPTPEVTRRQTSLADHRIRLAVKGHRWQARCADCAWTSPLADSMDEADVLARQHNAEVAAAAQGAPAPQPAAKATNPQTSSKPPRSKRKPPGPPRQVKEYAAAEPPVMLCASCDMPIARSGKCGCS